MVELTHIPASEREAEGDREEKQEEEGKGRRKGLGRQLVGEGEYSVQSLSHIRLFATP